MTPGIYTKLSMEEYLKATGVSASILWDALVRCPYAGWYASWLNENFVLDESSKAQGKGTIAHQILLEGSADCCAVIVPMDYPAEKTGNIPKGFTNKSIQAARDNALALGKIPILLEDFREVEAMVASARRYIASLRTSEPAIYAAFQPGGGDSEMTILWEEEVAVASGPAVRVPFRMRPDKISTDRTLQVDVKTTLTSAEPIAWGRTQMGKMGYYVSAAFYRSGALAQFGVKSDYVWLVIEQEPPYLCSLVGCDPPTVALGDTKIRRAKREWAECQATGVWPAYPNRVIYPELPPWELASEEIVEHGIPYDPAKMWGKPGEKIGFDHERDPFQ